jgi:glycolate oxidase iron-sulfur subunit
VERTSTIRAADAKAIESLSAPCVHCGFCLAACPTYAVTGMENDSPRGRIWLLADAARRGELSPAVRTHIDRCIGCEACVPACPSGVRYDKLIDLARGVVNSNRSPVDEASRVGLTTAFAAAAKVAPLVGPSQALARRVTNVAGRSHLVRNALGRLGPIETVVKQASTIQPQTSEPIETSMVANERGRVVLLAGCIGAVLFAEVNADTVRVLNAERISVIVPREQGCCGALASHAGRHRSARRHASALIAALNVGGVDAIVTNSAGCGAMMKDYGELLEGDPLAASFADRVVDVMEYLARLEPEGHYMTMDRSILYQEPCHLAFAQGIRQDPITVLARISGLEVEVVGGPNCCGAGGLYSIMQPDLARQVGEAKRDAILETGRDLMVSANPGCAIQLGSLLGDEVEVIHPISLMAEALGV